MISSSDKRAERIRKLERCAAKGAKYKTLVDSVGWKELRDEHGVILQSILNTLGTGLNIEEKVIRLLQMRVITIKKFFDVIEAWIRAGEVAQDKLNDMMRVK